MDSARSKLFWNPSPPLVSITRFVYETLIKGPSQTYPQGIAPVGNKAKDLISRVNALDQLFGTRPDDVEDQRLRDELIWYTAFFSHRNSALSPFQQVRGC